MPYCPKCGVEVDGGILKCPLCVTDIPDLGEEGENSRYPEKTEVLELTPGRKRVITWKVISIAIIMSLSLSATVDLVSYGKITFSRYVFASLALAWFYISQIIFLFKKLNLLTLSMMAVTIGYLAVLDGCNGKMEWFLELGLPISILSGVSALVLRFVYKQMRIRKVNFGAVLLLVIVGLCLGLNFVISSFCGAVNMNWSLIVMAALVPLSGLLFYLHYGLSKKIDYRKFFHS